ncbi:MAG: hypothetical protein V1697_03510 [Candidatus Levyibacteriota bacterium]
MSFISGDDWEEAQKKPRDANGKFVKKDVDPKDTVASSFEADSPLKKLRKALTIFLINLYYLFPLIILLRKYYNG